MSFNGSEGDFITLEKGVQLTTGYRAKYPTNIKGRFFGKDKLLEVLNQPGCMGIRMYFGCGGTAQLELVAVGADAEENDMLDKILDMSIPCPNRCSTPNALNP